MGLEWWLRIWLLSVLILRVNAAIPPPEPQGLEEDPIEYHYNESLKYAVLSNGATAYVLLVMIIIFSMDFYRLWGIRKEVKRNQSREPELQSKAKEVLDRIIFMNKETVGWETRRQEHEDIRHEIEKASRALIDSLNAEIDKYRKLASVGLKPGEKPPDELGYKAVMEKQRAERQRLLDLMKEANAAVDARLEERREDAAKERAAAVVQHMAAKKAAPNRMSRLIRRNQPDTTEMSMTVRRTDQRRNNNDSKPEMTVEEEEKSRTVDDSLKSPQPLVAVRRTTKPNELRPVSRDELTTAVRTTPLQRDEISTASRGGRTPHQLQPDELSTANRIPPSSHHPNEVTTANRMPSRTQPDEVTVAVRGVHYKAK